MVVREDDKISALVILRSAPGVPLTEQQITPENVEQQAPSPKDVTRVQHIFQELGFETGYFVGISFAISGLHSLFREVFAVQIERGDDGGLVRVDSDGTTSRDLPLAALPEPERSLVAKVVFEEPAMLF